MFSLAFQLNMEKAASTIYTIDGSPETIQLESFLLPYNQTFAEDFNLSSKIRLNDEGPVREDVVIEERILAKLRKCSEEVDEVGRLANSNTDDRSVSSDNKIIGLYIISSEETDLESGTDETNLPRNQEQPIEPARPEIETRIIDLKKIDLILLFSLFVLLFVSFVLLFIDLFGYLE